MTPPDSVNAGITPSVPLGDDIESAIFDRESSAVIYGDPMFVCSYKEFPASLNTCITFRLKSSVISGVKLIFSLKVQCEWQIFVC